MVRIIEAFDAYNRESSEEFVTDIRGGRKCCLHVVCSRWSRGRIIGWSTRHHWKCMPLRELLLTTRFPLGLVLFVSMLFCRSWFGIIQTFSLSRTKYLPRRRGSILFYHRTMPFNAYNLRSLLQLQDNLFFSLHGYQLRALPSATHQVY
jgi:hypothetical protein